MEEISRARKYHSQAQDADGRNCSSWHRNTFDSLFQPEHGLRQVPPICLKYTQALHTSISAGEIRRGEVTFTQITLCEMD